MKRIFIFIFLVTAVVLCHPLPIDTNVNCRLIIPQMTISFKEIKIPTINHKKVKMSAYNPTVRQCDSDPWIMAWNDRITHHNFDKIVAVSRDLLSILPKNTEIYFEDDGIIQHKEVLDKMGRYARKGSRKKYKIKNTIDILMRSRRDARKFGKQEKTIFWYAGETSLYQYEIRGFITIMYGDVNSILIPGCRIRHISKLGYVRVEGPDGQDYYISTNPPDNPALYVDGYAFTKMAMYVMCDKQDEDTVFECFYRKNPYDGGFAIAMGLSEVVNYLEQLEITGMDVDYLQTIWNFPPRFWEYLREFKWRGLLRSVPEGTTVQPEIPIHQIFAKLPVADFIETRPINLTGGPTMVATKALRMTLANPDVPWIEMAARRAQTKESGEMIAKYAFAGSAGKCIGTSLVSASKKWGIPNKGTTSHSSVLAFETQLESFRSHADLFVNNQIGDPAFILCTYGYVRGAQESVQIAKEMGIKNFAGRLDTDDLAFQSKVVREIFRGNGLYDAKIFLSNDIDEYVRRSLKEQNAEQDADGIGTSLNPPPMGVVYKPVYMNGRFVIKLSCPQKITNPGIKDIYCLYDDNGYRKAFLGIDYGSQLIPGLYHHSKRSYEKKKITDVSTAEKLLIPILENDSRLAKMVDVFELQDKVIDESKKMWPELKRFENPAEFPLYLDGTLWDIKQKLLEDYQIVKED